MRIGIAGYGQMGMLIRQKALSCGHEVPVVVDSHGTADEITARDVTSISAPLDVIIDFTHQQAVLDNIRIYGKLKIPAVIGTTGWYEHMDRAAAIVKESGIGLIWSGNFSLGVNLFFQLVETAGSLMNQFKQYDAAVHEYHHRHKADSPSGTAQMIGELMIKTLDRKTRVVSTLTESKIEDCELHLSSTRGGSVPGTHQVIFDSEVDTIMLEHCARSRAGFAEGALVAAQWVCNREGFFNINDLMRSIIGGGKDR